MVTLIDGSVVASDSLEWRDECLGRYVLSKSLDERRVWLDAFDKRHGAQAAQRLRDVMEALWEARRKE